MANLVRILLKASTSRSVAPIGRGMRHICGGGLSLVFLVIAFHAAAGPTENSARSLERVLQSNELIVLADVKHGVRDRIAFFSSTILFEAMARSGVRHVAIEMPRILGRQAMRIETDVDVEAFADDVLRADRWHFVDPDHPHEASRATQHRVAFALGRQVLLAKRLGINPIFYDFNNPLGGFTTYKDPVYSMPLRVGGRGLAEVRARWKSNKVTARRGHHARAAQS